MCCGPSLNLCKCGCPEIDHEEVIDLLEAAFSFPGHPELSLVLPGSKKRGKCHGKKLSPVVFKDGKPEYISLDPCGCEEYTPIFEPDCRLP